jgi:single-stranded-DNA-specific exonuclease
MAFNIRKPLDESKLGAFSKYSPLLAQILYYRDISDSEIFLNPDYDRDIHDPFLLKDAEKAAKRIIGAIKSNSKTTDSGSKNADGQKIAIYADYDADGIPGAALFHDFFKRINFSNFIIYIPHRHNEGFGLNEDAVKELAEKGVNVIVTVDCGISDFEPVKKANELGIEVIITDHHEPPEKMPEAYAIVDHKQKYCQYPDKNLCGTGVAFKLIQAILKIERFGMPVGHEKWLLDLVGIATLSDMVPLTGENRVFAKYGLSVLRKSNRKGLKQLLDHLRIAQSTLTETDIAFMIAPRINAASRMGLPMDAFNLLAADNDADARKAAEHLDHINNERKGTVAALVKEVKKAVKVRYGSEQGDIMIDPHLPAAIVLGNPDWRPSLLGLVANTCAEELKRPVFLWGRDGDNVIKGSCRSEGKSNVVEIMRAVKEGILIQFGGHKHSGGFAVSDDQIHFLDKYLVEAAELLKKTNVSTSDNIDSIDNIDDDIDFIDAELSLDEINIELWNEIDKLSPFGIGNPAPVFILKNVTPTNVRIFGKGNEHIELIFKQKNGNKLSAISFFGAVSDWAKKIASNAVASSNGSNATELGSISKCDVVFSLEKSYFRSRPELRLRIIDVIMLP